MVFQLLAVLIAFVTWMHGLATPQPPAPEPTQTQPVVPPPTSTSPTPAPTPAPTPTPSPSAGSFVQRSGSTLTLDGAPFRFSGTNMYWLALDDNVRDAQGPTHPTPFRVDDAMTSARAGGATVVRAWASTVGCPRCIEPTLGQFPASAFVSLDHAVASARAHGLRMVLTLTDNWAYYNGGKLTYTGWRGVGEADFFTNPTVIGDYQRFITTVLTHVNPETGLAYRDDPTIMGWETGNEMYCQSCPGNPWFPQWTAAIANHIDSLAPRQLVVDGHGTDPACTTGCLDVPSLDIPTVDVVDDHHYPRTVARVQSAAALTRAHGKAYLVGEYDWRTSRGSPLPDFLAAIETSGAAGDLGWVTVPHADTTGYVDHDDGYQLFYPGATPDERNRVSALRQHAARMTGAALPASVTSAVLDAPRLSSAAAGAGGVALTWRGVGAADTYTVQRSVDGVGWSTVLTGVRDQRVIHGPTATDATGGQRAGLRYRVRAVSVGGTPGSWSAVVTAG